LKCWRLPKTPTFGFAAPRYQGSHDPLLRALVQRLLIKRMNLSIRNAFGLAVRKNPKCPFCLSFLILSLLAVPACLSEIDQVVPVGFKVERYRAVWEKDPFNPPTPEAQAHTTPFDKIILLSWLEDGPATIVFVENTDTKEVHKITANADANNIRLIALHKHVDPAKAEALLSDGKEQGLVRFRMELALAATAPETAIVSQPAGAVAQQPSVAASANAQISGSTDPRSPLFRPRPKRRETQLMQEVRQP